MLSFRLILSLGRPPAAGVLPCPGLSPLQNTFLLFNISPNVILFPSVFLVLLWLPIVPIFPLTPPCSSHEMFLRFPLHCSLPNPLLENRSTKLGKIMLLAPSFPASSVSSPPSLPPFPCLPRRRAPSRHALATPQSTQALEASWKNCLGLLEGEKIHPCENAAGIPALEMMGKCLLRPLVKGL